jgi:hypothetical protein
MLATWLHLGAPKNSQKNSIYNLFQTLNYPQLILNQNWTCLVLQEACERCNSPMEAEVLKIKLPFRMAK